MKKNMNNILINNNNNNLNELIAVNAVVITIEFD